MPETNTTANMQSFVDKFVDFSARLANQVHLRSLRDAFAAVMPIFILAGLAVLVNNVVFPWVLEGETLVRFKVWGEAVINGTLNIAALLIAPMTAWSLARNRNFDNPVSAVVIALSSYIMMMPMHLEVVPDGAKTTVTVSQMLSFANIGSTGIFAGVIIGLLSTELFIRIAGIEKLNISLGENVPPAVGKSFSALIPTIITLSTFAVIAAVLANVLHTDLIHLITTLIQQPLRLINTSLPGTIFIYSFGNFLFTLGIHQSVVNGVILEPFLLINTNENMLAFANGQPIPHIINNIFVPTFGMIGGTGSTISLLLAIFIFSRQKSAKQVARLSISPGLFNINEPVIFGLPIVFNLPLMIPFVLLPAIGIYFAWLCTTLGWMSRCVVMIPWTTPPILSAWLATAGDWRAVVVQLIIIVFGVFFYLPFLKIAERVALRNNGIAE
ncbi:Lichenan permease IIC component [Phytobacter ursingii]|uniref:Permease IIC component n=2 Tax=Enterobacteriaceae TaxID=543 RepID=A0AB35RPW9_9ENTR|nr:MULTISPECIES: PTS transporter subunit EIIC [Enterobacteriaceae]MDV2864184.1 PTS transporter subunit EIIC [Phytobacter ursingii]ORJ48952.1 PTS cellobiose transporter subunit IIC [Kluyvera intermedia]VTP14865.1 Lichenan permease IIC component [Phytobacter ursingii]GJL35175.1 permease IIC component [Enterobacter hormaechei]HAT2610869.1 PTS sugar transporter subunit IIC [Kluyvera intermedia]